MAGRMAAAAGKKYASGRAEQLAPQDPMYETYVDERGQEQRRKRALPPGLTPKEEKLLKKIRKRARRLDRGMSLCGFRVGWTFWLGLIPGLGDIVDFLLSYFLVIRPATRGEGVPASLKAKMVSNQTVAFVCGLVPLAGDIVMAMCVWSPVTKRAYASAALTLGWRSNSRNSALFERYLTDLAALRMRETGVTAEARSEQAAQESLATASKWRWSRVTGKVEGREGYQASGASKPVTGQAMV